jgi:ubiquinone/menaquinone biosynthesis C-methylase UbiE
MNRQHIDTSYEPFSREPEYINGNRDFIQEIPFSDAKRVLDLACGTGTISELILEVNPNITIVGLDLSRESLTLGLKDFLAKGLTVRNGFVISCDIQGAKPKLALIEGTADCLPFKDNWADIVFMGHAIHNLPDLDLLLEEIRRVLIPDGLFAFNSSFYAGSQAPGTDHFYQFWWKFAVSYILEKDAELKKRGLPGIPRKRGTSPKARPWLSKEDWTQLLYRHGFEINTLNERQIMMTQSNFETVGSYSGLARVMISGYPEELASEALKFAVVPAFEAVGLEQVPRLWLEMSARKT